MRQFEKKARKEKSKRQGPALEVDSTAEEKAVSEISWGNLIEIRDLELKLQEKWEQIGRSFEIDDSGESLSFAVRVCETLIAHREYRSASQLH